MWQILTNLSRIHSWPQNFGIKAFLLLLFSFLFFPLQLSIWLGFECGPGFMKFHNSMIPKRVVGKSWLVTMSGGGKPMQTFRQRINKNDQLQLWVVACWKPWGIRIMVKSLPGSPNMKHCWINFKWLQLAFNFVLINASTIPHVFSTTTTTTTKPFSAKILGLAMDSHVFSLIGKMIILCLKELSLLKVKGYQYVLWA